MESYNKIDLRKYFIQRFDSISYFLPDCYKLKRKSNRRFVTFRLKIHSKKLINMPTILLMRAKQWQCIFVQNNFFLNQCIL